MDTTPPHTAATSTSVTALHPLRTRRWRQWGIRAARGALVLLFVLGAYLSLWPQGRAAARSTLLLASFVSASQLPALTVSGDPIRHTQRTISSANGPVYLDIYAPATPAPPVPRAREGLLVIPGVGDERHEPQLVNFSESVARAGLVVMDMTTDTLISNTLLPADTDAVVAAYRELERWPDVSPERVGLLGFSAGDALACLAASDSRIRDNVAFVTSFGGYFDAESLLADVGQRAQVVDGRLKSWTPNPLTLQVLANTIASTLPPDEASLLADPFALGGQPLTSDQLALLPTSAVSAYHLLQGDQPDRVQANVAALSPDMHALFSSLSPRSVISRIRAPIYLFHDQTDPYVPFTQSREFAAALTQLGRSHAYAELTIFAHTEVKTGLGIGPLLRDGWSLFIVLIGLLSPAS